MDNEIEQPIDEQIGDEIGDETGEETADAIVEETSGASGFAALGLRVEAASAD